MQSGAKNPPWARPPVNANTNAGIGQFMDTNMAMSQQGIMPFQQPTVFNPSMLQSQAGLGMQIGNQMQITPNQIYNSNVVAYPTPRSINQNYQGTQVNNQATPDKQRVFTGTVTKTLNDFGFVDEDVFYQTSVCAKGNLPKVGDRVLVEAVYNPAMPFKWNATRVQLLPNTSSSNQSLKKTSNSGYNAVPPPSRHVENNDRFKKTFRRDERPIRRESELEKRRRTRSRSRSPKRRRESPPARRDSPIRRDSPERSKRRSAPPLPKYMVRVPKVPLSICEADVVTLSLRYTSLYIPSDFFNCNVKWCETFPPDAPFPLNNPCSFHIKSKDMDDPRPNTAVLDPPDADYSYSAKVMLLSLPPLDQFYQKCGLGRADDKEKNERSEKAPLHPTRLIKFLVGNKGKSGDHLAIGGPWSPSLDGLNPDSDPTVLIKTAIRTCKALTGIDLSSCTQWYRVVEFNYWRTSSSRLEKVVMLVCDVWSALGDWEQTKKLYADTLNKILETSRTKDTEDNTIEKKDDDKGDKSNESNLVATHHSKIDLKTIKVDALRQELKARDAPTKGVRSQLVARLKKLIQTEANGDNTTEVMADDSKVDESKDDIESKLGEDVVVIDDTEDDKVQLEKEVVEIEIDREKYKSMYELPSTSHIIVHPSKTAKGGKFNCAVVTLSLLLDYRVADNKEHNFEIFVFAEIFNEMLMRDFGFYIYKILSAIPADDCKEITTNNASGSKEDDKKKSEKDEDRSKERRSRRSPTSDEILERSLSPSRRRHILPHDPYLLLSFFYFDTTRCTYFQKKDLQQLFMSLGLKLSRSQVTVLLDKICQQSNYFVYRHLLESVQVTSSVLQDLPEDIIAKTESIHKKCEEMASVLARGNIISESATEDANVKDDKLQVSQSGIVLYKSRVVDVGATLSALQRSEAARTKAESIASEATNHLRNAKQQAATAVASSKSKSEQLSKANTEISKLKHRLSSLMMNTKIFHSTLRTIQTKVDAVININYDPKDEPETNSQINEKSKDKKDIKKEDKKTDAEVTFDKIKSNCKVEEKEKVETCEETEKEKVEDSEKTLNVKSEPSNETGTVITADSEKDEEIMEVDNQEAN